MKTWDGKIEYPAGMSEHAKHLISHLCARKKRGRYSARHCLKHPFITGRHSDPYPLTDEERQNLAIQNQPIEDKLRKVMRVMFICSISRSPDSR